MRFSIYFNEATVIWKESLDCRFLRSPCGRPSMNSLVAHRSFLVANASWRVGILLPHTQFCIRGRPWMLTFFVVHVVSAIRVCHSCQKHCFKWVIIKAPPCCSFLYTCTFDLILCVWVQDTGGILNLWSNKPLNNLDFRDPDTDHSNPFWNSGTRPFY